MDKSKDSKQQEVVFEYVPEQHATVRRHNNFAPMQGRDGLDERPSPDPKAAQEAFAKREAAGGGRTRREFETLGGHHSFYETPENRLSKLQAEVVELSRAVEMNRLKDGDKAAELLGSHPSDMAAELKVLEQRLVALAKEGNAPWGKGADKALGSTPGPMAVPGSLMCQLEMFASGGAVASTDSSTKNVTYEINYVPNIRGVVDSTRVAALENSLADIERCLGSAGHGVTCGDLHTAVGELHKRVSLLDANKMEAINQRVKTVMSDVDRLLEKKTELENAARNDEVDQKVSELYSFCHRWHAASSSLPTIVARLRSLQVLHEQSANFSARLTALEGQQDEIMKLLEATNTAVAELGTGLTQNMSIMRDNMKTLEDKMAKAMGK
eukprot:TRINITY_DN48119_c0_g1_i1.p1 TRINITY_DN48119_c0_g1~~TRINITY_DN48119_c0_g1_i1.p1  ORF type:complete len:383 (-),score=111.76 TRINITY_DN48119_c0_g1_i1:66-1214(-)